MATSAPAAPVQAERGLVEKFFAGPESQASVHLGRAYELSAKDDLLDNRLWAPLEGLKATCIHGVETFDHVVGLFTDTAVKVIKFDFGGALWTAVDHLRDAFHCMAMFAIGLVRDLLAVFMPSVYDWVGYGEVATTESAKASKVEAAEAKAKEANEKLAALTTEHAATVAKLKELTAEQTNINW